MEYMLMCCGDEKEWDALPDSERDRVMREYDELIQEIKKSGCYRAGGQLTPSSTATTLREKNGKTIILDGPFTETKEQLGGYHLVECKDLDEAISIAKHIPSLRVGGVVEVRAVIPES
jgi:hypothetical protein